MGEVAKSRMPPLRFSIGFVVESVRSSLLFLGNLSHGFMASFLFCTPILDRGEGIAFQISTGLGTTPENGQGWQLATARMFGEPRGGDIG